MEGRKKKHRYPTDTEAGIRTITTIRSLPSGQLTDEEFVKEFFDRFEAKALIMLYVDSENDFQSFGRLKKGSTVFGYYRMLSKRFEQLFNNSMKENI